MDDLDSFLANVNGSAKSFLKSYDDMDLDGLLLNFKSKVNKKINFDFESYFEKEVKTAWFKNLYVLDSNYATFLYCIYYGGRLRGKTEAIARSIIINCTIIKNSTILCARHVQNSIEDSVKPLLERIIEEYIEKGYIPKNHFLIKKNEIVDKNKNKIIFKGLQDWKASDIKGLDNIKICWLEEAAFISYKMLSYLLKTIVRFNCKFIASFNRELINDPIYDYFVKHKKADTLDKYLIWKDNPFLPDTAEKQRLEDLKNMSEDKYNHDWLGEPYTEEETLLFKNDILENMLSYKAENTLLLDKNIMGVDVAKGDKDKTVIIIRNNNKIVLCKSYNNCSAQEVANEILNLQNEYKIDKIYCDVGNIGYAVDQLLFNYHLDFYRKYFNPVLFGSEPINSMFLNKRAEMYYVCEQFIRNHNLDVSNMIDKDREEILDNMQYVPIEPYSEKIKIVGKDKIKKITGKSPDFLDALVLTFAEEEYIETTKPTKDNEKEKSYWEKKLEKLMYGDVIDINQDKKVKY